MSFSLVLGGGTSAGFTTDIIVQLISLAALTFGLMTMRSDEVAHFRTLFQSGVGRLTAGLIIGLLGLYLIQLAPLPLAWVSFGPLGSEGVNGLISRVPYSTGAALASLLPPITVFILALSCSASHRQVAISLLAVIGIVSLIMGFLQVAQGPSSALRIYEFTNRVDAVGFFANRNHFASLLCILLIFVSVWLLSMISQSAQLPAIAVSGALACLVAVLTGLMLARSRAGLLLAMIVFGCIIVIYWLDRRHASSSGRRQASSGSRWLIAGSITAIVIAVQLGLSRIMARFEVDPLDDLRWSLTESGISLALASLPFGTGIASYVQSYATFERTSDITGGAFANRTHNDWVEFAIEGGLPAIALMLCFLLWFGFRILSCPRESSRRRLQHISGSLIILVLLLHSIVDYPLRTTALATVFAFACALLLPPPSEQAPKKVKELDDMSQQSDTEDSVEAIGKWTPAAGGQVWPDAWK